MYMYNEDQMIGQTMVKSNKWVPGHGDTFIVSHASGHLYTYQAEHDCGNFLLNTRTTKLERDSQSIHARLSQPRTQYTEQILMKKMKMISIII